MKVVNGCTTVMLTFWRLTLQYGNEYVGMWFKDEGLKGQFASLGSSSNIDIDGN